MYFKLLPKAGNHVQKGPDGELITYRAEDGGVIESDTDLAKAFPNKFEKVEGFRSESGKVQTKGETPEEKKDAVQTAAEDGAKDLEPPKEPEKTDEDSGGGEGGEEPKEPHPLGKDVTDRFSIAEEEGLMVFVHKGAYSVVEEDDPTVPLNEDLLKKNEVTAFIEKYLEE